MDCVKWPNRRLSPQVNNSLLIKGPMFYLGDRVKTTRIRTQDELPPGTYSTIRLSALAFRANAGLGNVGDACTVIKNKTPRSARLYPRSCGQQMKMARHCGTQTIAYPFSPGKLAII